MPAYSRRFCRAFFGGGGITIGLLKRGVLNKLVIAEKDESLKFLWFDIIYCPDRLIRAIKGFTPSVTQFINRKQRILAGDGSAFDALVVNRLSHGGRGVKAGPQGGFDQKGAHKIGCRWNSTRLITEIRALHDLFSTVSVYVRDDYQCDADYYYMDPPYWEVGDQLYLHNFTEADHLELFNFLKGKDFLLSYNNHPKVRKLYAGHKIVTTSTSGNGGEKKDSELLIWRK